VVCNLADAQRDVPVDRPVEHLLLSSDPRAACTAAAVTLPAESVAIARVDDRAHT
jgi:hypothetical protein